MIAACLRTWKCFRFISVMVLLRYVCATQDHTSGTRSFFGGKKMRCALIRLMPLLMRYELRLHVLPRKREHMGHIMIHLVANIDDPRGRDLYERLRCAFNVTRSPGPLPFPPLEEWQGMAAYCDNHPCRCVRQGKEGLTIQLNLCSACHSKRLHTVMYRMCNSACFICLLSLTGRCRMFWRGDSCPCVWPRRCRREIRQLSRGYRGRLTALYSRGRAPHVIAHIRLLTILLKLQNLHIAAR